MTDLRTRITDAIWDEARTIGSTLSLKASGLIADAVIRELNLIDGDALNQYLGDIKTAFDIGTTNE